MEPARGLTLALLWAAASAAAAPVLRFQVVEDAGIARKRALLEQGVPAPPMESAAVARLAVRDASGRAVPAGIEADGGDPRGRVRWLRLSLPVDLAPWEKRELELVEAPGSPPPPLKVESAPGRIAVESGSCRALFENPNRMRLIISGKELFDGAVTFQVYSDARSIINAGGKTTVLSGFEPRGFRVETPAPHRAVVTLSGRYPKQKPYSSAPGQTDPNNGFDVDLRLHFSSLTDGVAFDWRLINRTGYRSWLERYALVLPLKWGARAEVEASFLEDLGAGAGVRVEPAGLLIGGLDMPPDGGVGRETPEIHRLFHHGMARTFRGWIAPEGRARNFAPGVHLTLAPQTYSDLGILPERGDPVTAGEFAPAVERSGRWLLDRQWRGTLWWGEWWREWDAVRRQGAEEASNGNSVLAPLYHYLRTGDRRFLDCAGRAASFAFDVQHDRKKTGFGPMMHTRRHLLDELDWIHPRYQRAFGPILASHVLLMDRERRELIATVRHFSERIQDASGVPHDWDERRNQRAGETGVDTANFIEALIAAWNETGDPFFLERARGYARWTVGKWRARTGDSQWNWNLTRYLLTGLLAICRVAREYPELVPESRDLIDATAAISRHTVAHPELGFVPGTIGSGGLHYLFYHAWLGSEVSRLVNDPELIRPLAAAIRKEMARQDASGAFPMDVGSLWSQYPTRVISYYDPKAVVAYLPVLAARQAAQARRK